MPTPEMIFPLLGEPLVVEFANTLYRDPDGEVDFLSRPTWAVEWCRAAAPRTLDPPNRLSATECREIQALRNALIEVFESQQCRPASITRAAVDEINASACIAAPLPAIELRAGQPHRVVRRTGSKAQVLRATLADQAIELIVGPRLAMIRRCTRPDCNMWFEQQHHRRAYCNVRCANAHRQSRYHHRSKSTATVE